MVVSDTAPKTTASIILKITLTLNKIGAGTISSDDNTLNCGDDCQKTYAANTQLLLTATAATDSLFTHWSGTDPRIKFIIDEPKICTAHFALDPDAVMHALTVHITGNGQVTAPQWHSDNCQQGCTLYYPAEQKLRLKAKAAPLSTFVGWNGDCSGQRQTTPLVMTEDKTCSATFQSDFKRATDDIIDIFYAEAKLKNGDLTTHYPRSANETCLKEAFWLNTFALMHTDQHYQIIQNGPTQIDDIEWYTPLAAEYCTRSIKTMSGEYIDIALELKTAANSEELSHIIIYYTDEQPNVDYQPVIFFERGVFSRW